MPWPGAEDGEERDWRGRYTEITDGDPAHFDRNVWDTWTSRVHIHGLADVGLFRGCHPHQILRSSTILFGLLEKNMVYGTPVMSEEDLTARLSCKMKNEDATQDVVENKNVTFKFTENDNGTSKSAEKDNVSSKSADNDVTTSAKWKCSAETYSTQKKKNIVVVMYNVNPKSAVNNNVIFMSAEIDHVYSKSTVLVAIYRAQKGRTGHCGLRFQRGHIIDEDDESARSVVLTDCQEVSTLLHECSRARHAASRWPGCGECSRMYGQVLCRLVEGGRQGIEREWEDAGRGAEEGEERTRKCVWCVCGQAVAPRGQERQSSVTRDPIVRDALIPHRRRRRRGTGRQNGRHPQLVDNYPW
ncbi:hypothetical protein PR048_010134 [Dryococelus australis]|uniref:Uncharacterized protein n=1 Tax=Dryococelus australis TaxID=614101 RepID=A0ABQ9I1V1_9NEOP|nr:hypothetical protein PR048_010134 [Dryococelus australis]